MDSSAHLCCLLVLAPQQLVLSKAFYYNKESQHHLNRCSESHLEIAGCPLQALILVPGILPHYPTPVKILYWSGRGRRHGVEDEPKVLEQEQGGKTDAPHPLSTSLGPPLISAPSLSFEKPLEISLQHRKTISTMPACPPSTAQPGMRRQWSFALTKYTTAKEPNRVSYDECPWPRLLCNGLCNVNHLDHC